MAAAIDDRKAGRRSQRRSAERSKEQWDENALSRVKISGMKFLDRVTIRAEERMYDGIINVYKEKFTLPRCRGENERDPRTEKDRSYRDSLTRRAEGFFRCVCRKKRQTCDMLTDQGKTYRAVLLERETDTEDTTGTVIGTKDTSGLLQKVRSVTKSSPLQGL